jgi:hypothetical protein
MLTIDDVIERFDGSLAYSTNSKEICQYIADLLKELKERRKAPEIIYCKDCTRRRKNTETGEYYCRASGLRNTDYDFCSGGKRAERRTE